MCHETYILVSATPQSLDEMYGEPDYIELMKEGKMTSALAKQTADYEDEIYDPEMAKSPKESPKSSKGSLQGSAKARSRSGSGRSKASSKSYRKSQLYTIDLKVDFNHPIIISDLFPLNYTNNPFWSSN